jgi:RNA polymerase primary sigma factor
MKKFEEGLVTDSGVALEERPQARSIATCRHAPAKPVFSSAALTKDEQDELRILMAKTLDFRHDPALDEPNAAQQLFGEPLDLPEPATDWFIAVMEGSDDSGSRGAVSSLLTGEQERTLLLRFNYARKRLIDLRLQISKAGVPGVKIVREFLHWNRVASEHRDLMAKFNLGLIVAMSKRSRARNLEFSEQVSEGSMALLHAVDKFNPSLGFKFSTYACKLILNALNHAGIKQSRHRAIFATGFELGSDRADQSTPEVEDAAYEMQVKRIRSIVDSNDAELSELEQSVIQHRFPLGDSESDQPLTLAEVGRMVGLTKEGVRRVQIKALKKIRMVISEQYPELGDHFADDE